MHSALSKDWLFKEGASWLTVQFGPGYHCPVHCSSSCYVEHNVVKIVMQDTLVWSDVANLLARIVIHCLKEATSVSYTLNCTNLKLCLYRENAVTYNASKIFLKSLYVSAQKNAAMFWTSRLTKVFCVPFPLLRPLRLEKCSVWKLWIFIVPQSPFD